MLGFFFIELKQYITSKKNDAAWNAVLDKAGLSGKTYLNGLDYPDKEMVKLVVSEASMAGTPVGHVLREFGRFLGGDLFTAYRPLIDTSWKTLDFLEHVEETIHKVVRARNRKAEPPRLVVNRITEREVMIDYRSKRKFCQLAQGIVLGVADHYGEKIELVEESCMHRGDPSCKIWVALEKTSVEEDIWGD